jgi:hypothetical protein
MIGDKPLPNWRDEQGLVSTNLYKRKFAWYPVTCNDGTTIWFSNYYKKYTQWNNHHAPAMSQWDYGHTDFIENISEAEYIVRKLAENL